ncbi:metallophosphoesterase family protein [Acetobacterium woodii]|uniref:Putative metallophosphoesterase MppE n=1 Tax=Acetobacterium woodii (strain ATCC 29683 / DSM 1030 / JCM 2381 / KCTC 1655 / WB1) TaxID=931626 RepID=H6LFH4_ACEWD|nr:DNA repair exonuclease [Acetobacterium woodii]AFA49461.1 putative metallophosphoesterase MppE [Acetobacterium woodii DSM 1030]
MLTTFIHTGDFHLGRPFTFRQQGNYHGKNKRKELWKAFEDMIEFANEGKIPLILIAGDLFDSVNVLTMDIKRAAEGFASLEKTWVVIITGNHDYHGDSSPYKKVEWPSNVYIFKEDVFRSVYIKELNTEIYGMSWVKNEYRAFPERSFNAIKLNKSRYNILMVHGEVTNKSLYLPIDLRLIEKKGFNFIALGHIHKPGLTPGGVAYCGSPIPFNFGETGERGFLISQVETDYINETYVTSSGFNPIESRSYETVEILIAPEDSYHDIINKAIKCDAEEKRMQNYYRIRFSGYIDPEIQLDWINDDLEDSFYYVETDTSQLEPDIDLDLLIKENKNNPIGQLLMELEKIEESEVRKKAIIYAIEAMIGEGVLK